MSTSPLSRGTLGSHSAPRRRSPQSARSKTDHAKGIGRRHDVSDQASSDGTASKRETGRSRNACDRCKQKKVKCDGENGQICSICREGDHHCNYMTKPHEEKRYYRKGYVEMVEEANEYYKQTVHALYARFRSDPIFAGLGRTYNENNRPTVQEIAIAAGVPRTGRPSDGGIEAIAEHLKQMDKPMLERRAEWDEVVEDTPSPSTLATSHEQIMSSSFEDETLEARKALVRAAHLEPKIWPERLSSESWGHVYNNNGTINSISPQPSPRHSVATVESTPSFHGRSSQSSTQASCRPSTPASGMPTTQFFPDSTVSSHLAGQQWALPPPPTAAEAFNHISPASTTLGSSVWPQHGLSSYSLAEGVTPAVGAPGDMGEWWGFDMSGTTPYLDPNPRYGMS